MGYTSININYNEGNLCEEITFSEPGNKSYVLGSTITLSDQRLSRDRSLVVMNVNHTEDESSGVSTTVSGFSEEYKWTRKAPDYDISFLTMTHEQKRGYETASCVSSSHIGLAISPSKAPRPDSGVYIMNGDEYGANGWSMHSIVQKISVFMGGLIIENNLPDYWISDFSISLGSTFFEAINSLISEFEPIISLIDGVLYILERNGVGIFSIGGITPTGFINRSVNAEHVPAPGCIRVEGSEGKYIAAKDPEISPLVCPDPPCVSYFVGKAPWTKSYFGTVTAPDESKEEYSILEYYDYGSNGDEFLYKRVQTSTLSDSDGHGSSMKITIEYEHDDTFDILEKSTETCEAIIDDSWVVYNIISTSYEHDDCWALIGQVTSRQELFIHDSDTGNYSAYDPRDSDLADLAETETSQLISSEIRTTRYSEIDLETYGVETIIANKVWSESDAEWQTLYTFEHDIVEAGSLQQNTRGGESNKKTLQVYAGNCPVYAEDLSTINEPAKIFSISTPDWNNIEDCYVYLSALVSREFLTASASVPIIDPLPLMRINGLGSIVEAEMLYGYYVRGYTINIDPNSGYTTELNLEARKRNA